MNTLAEIIEYKKYTIEIHHDHEPSNPRKRDFNLGTMVCFHRQYNLGDKHDFILEEAKKYAKSKDIIMLPLYLYDHSGLTMRTTPFDCPWDSGQIGFIYITKEKAREEFGYSRLSKRTIKRAKNQLEAEVEAYNWYISGQTYGFIILNPVGVNVESCWDFLGDPKGEGGMLDYAKSRVDHIIIELERASKEKFPQESKEATMKILQESEQRRRDDEIRTSWWKQ